MVVCFDLIDMIAMYHLNPQFVKLDAGGLDNINPRFINIILPWIARPVFFQQNLHTPKSYHLQKLGNEYSTISRLPYLSKPFERIIYKQITEFIN